MAKILLISIALVLVGYSSGAVVNGKQVDLKCIPKKGFTFDHNYCQCNDDGSEILCERKLYTTLTPKLHKYQLQRVEQDCTPGELVEIPCQTCVCDKSGKSANCVRTNCPDEKVGTRDECVAGTVFADECNTCICGADGKGVCTQLDCPVVGHAFPNKTTCVPDSENSVFRCNLCTCSANGRGLFCDRMGCSTLDFDHENLLNVTTPCAPDTTFAYNCHQCQCDETGNYGMCSGTPCPNEEELAQAKVVNTVDKCNPGFIFANECNVCICNENGKGTCTTVNCDLSYRFKYV